MSTKLEVKTLDRSQINDDEWNQFIAASPQGANYAMTWYLDVIWPDWQGVQVFYKNHTLDYISSTSSSYRMKKFSR